jgi:hypothetical protein
MSKSSNLKNATKSSLQLARWATGFRRESAIMSSLDTNVRAFHGSIALSTKKQTIVAVPTWTKVGKTWRMTHAGIVVTRGEPVMATLVEGDVVVADLADRAPLGADALVHCNGSGQELRLIFPRVSKKTTVTFRLAGTLATIGEVGDDEEAVSWSKPDSPTRWAKVFKCTLRTMVRYLETQKVRNKRLSSRSYQIALSDVPKSQ